MQKGSTIALWCFWNISRRWCRHVNFYGRLIRWHNDENKCYPLVFESCVSFSIPGKDIAIFLNKLLTLCPAFADVSMNIMFSWVAWAVASSSVTCLREYKFGKTEGWRRTRYVPFVGKVCLVSYQHNNDIVSSLWTHIVYPLWGRHKRLSIWISNSCVSEPANKGPESNWTHWWYQIQQ